MFVTNTTAMRHTLALLAFCFTALLANAQQATIKGRIFDSTLNRGLAYASVSLVHAKDSTLVTYTKADSSGYFSLKRIGKGDYLISSSYVGHVTGWHPVSVKEGETAIEAGNVYLLDNAVASHVTVNSRRPPVTINNDTLEFNTENFKTPPNSVVEDMLKKMPGVTIESDGTVKVNGQAVRKVLVNGKEFFTGDPKMATKNLPADAVDKVQVFDKKSDQSEFTGVDDGNTQKTINLKLKSDRAKALFGKLTAGGGTNERYDAQGNINRFNGEEQMSFLGMGNNTNRQGFTFSDVMNFTGELARGLKNGGGITIRNSDETPLPVAGLGQNQQGVATTVAGGVNYNNTWNKKTDLNSSYTGNDMHLVTNKHTETQNLLPNNTFTRIEDAAGTRDYTQHRINAAWDQKIDSSFSFKMTPSLTFQNSQSDQRSVYQSVTPAGVKINEGTSANYTNNEAVNFVNNILLRKRFAKKGRTISANISMAYNHSQSKGTMYSKNTYYTGTVTPKDSIIDQRNSRDAVTKNGGVNVVYTEPAGKRSLVELSGYINTNIGESVKQTYDLNGSTQKYDALNTRLSNDFNSRYTYTGGGLNYRTNQEHFNLTAGASFQAATLDGTNNTHNQKINQSFKDVLPNLTFQYMFSRMKNLRFTYLTSTTQPSLAQLQPVADISDPLNITTGNPDLKRQYNHTATLNFMSADLTSGTSFFAYLNGTKNVTAIVNEDSIKTDGTRISRPVNADGVYNLVGSANFAFRVKPLKARIEIGVTTFYSHNISFINGDKNIIENTSIGPNFAYNFSKDNVVDLRLTARLAISKAAYSLQSQLNSNYLAQTYGGETTNYLPFGFILNNQFTYTINSGRADGFNKNIPLWTASLAKGFLKNKRAELKLSVYDILNQNVGITRSANQNYITDQRYNVLTRYALLSFTYSLNKSGLGNKTGGPAVSIRTF